MARLRELCGGEPAPGNEARLAGTPKRLAELQEQFDAVPAAAKKAAAETKDRIVGQVRAAYAAKGLQYPPAKEELEPMDTPEAASTTCTVTWRSISRRPRKSRTCCNPCMARSRSRGRCRRPRVGQKIAKSGKTGTKTLERRFIMPGLTVINGAVLVCDVGSQPVQLSVTSNAFVTIDGELVATVMDMNANTNIPAASVSARSFRALPAVR